MNNHFVTNGPKLAQKLPAPTGTSESFLGEPILQSFVMHPTSQNEIEDLIEKLKV